MTGVAFNDDSVFAEITGEEPIRTYNIKIYKDHLDIEGVAPGIRGYLQFREVIIASERAILQGLQGELAVLNDTKGEHETHGSE